MNKTSFEYRECSKLMKLSHLSLVYTYMCLVCYPLNLNKQKYSSGIDERVNKFVNDCQKMHDVIVPMRNWSTISFNSRRYILGKEQMNLDWNSTHWLTVQTVYFNVHLTVFLERRNITWLLCIWLNFVNLNLHHIKALITV